MDYCRTSLSIDLGGTTKLTFRPVWGRKVFWRLGTF